MFKNYLKTAWRNLLKNKFYSLINISGLTVGLAIGIMILFWVQDELSFDSFHRNTKNIYRLENQVGTGSSIQIWTVTNAPIATEAKNLIPAVKETVRMGNNDFFSVYKHGDKKFSENNAFFTDPSLFSVFDFPLIKGDSRAPFPNIHSTVITEQTARRYFGQQDPMGKIILANDSIPFTVSGVIRDIPRNSSIKADMFVSTGLLNYLLHRGRPGEDINNDWEQFNYTTFLLLQPGTSVQALADRLKEIHLKHEPKDTDIKYLPFPMEKMHLFKADGSAAGIETVRIFTIIALLILAIACINYVNLSTARSMLRSKEVSLRKIVGAGKVQLFIQFLAETALLFMVAAGLAILVIYLLLPLFNSISGKSLQLDLTNYHIWLIIGISILGTLVVSSIYPALLLSSFEPIKALKGKITSGVGDAAFRKILVVCQFTVSVALITGTLVISKQLNYIQTKELGYDKSQVFALVMPNTNKYYEAFRNQLLRLPGVQAVSRSSGNIVNLQNLTGNNSWEGKLPDQTFMVYPLSVDKDFIPFFKMTLLKGKNFSGMPSDSAMYILNETAVRQAGIQDPIGKPFTMFDKKGIIGGIVKDFHFSSLKNKVEPAVFFFKPEFANAVFIKTSSAQASRAISSAQQVWNQFNASQPFSYTFLEETFQQLYQSEQRTSELFNIFALIAIFISSLGLLGLAVFTTQVRTREIGVRKVLGASVSGIIRLLATDFIRLVLIAVIIATPLSWYFMNKWLENFAYQTSIGWLVYLASGMAAILVALLTISIQSIKAALSNPIKNLRTE